MRNFFSILDANSPTRELPLEDYLTALKLGPINGTTEPVNDSIEVSPRRESVGAPFTFPYGPIFQQFFPDLEASARNAFAEVLALSYCAIKAVCARTPEFYRYFDEGDANTVYNMFTYVSGSPQFVGAWEMARLPLYVVYGNRPGTIGDPIDRCQATPSLNAYMQNRRMDIPYALCAHVC